MILDQIIERTKEDLALRKSQTPFEKLQELAVKKAKFCARRDSQRV